MRLAQSERLLREMGAKLDDLEERRDVSVGGELVSAGYVRIISPELDHWENTAVSTVEV